MVPEILRIGPISLSGYVFFYCLGIVAGSIVTLALAKKDNLDVQDVLNYLVFLAIFSILGSKLYSFILGFFAFHTADLNTLDRFLATMKSGGAFHGAFIFGLIFSIFYLKKFFKDKSWLLFDAAVVGLALCQFFGRLGCFTAGCCYGSPTSCSLGVSFPHLNKSIHPFAGTAIHPTQLYEAFLDIMNSFILFFIWRKRKFEGQIFSLYLVNYGFIRFFVEYLRNDGGRGYLVKGDSALISLSYPQVISIILVTTGFIILAKRKKAKAN